MFASIRAKLVDSMRAHLCRRGFDLVRVTPSAMSPSSASLPALLKLILPLLLVDAVIDVGANEGQYGEFLRTLGYSGLVVSFEPATAPFTRLLRRAATDSNWLTYQLAAGSQMARAHLNLARSSDLNSFRRISQFGEQLLGVSQESLAMEQVGVVRLDDFLPSILREQGARRLMIKLDTQGWDLEAAKGAEGLMDQVVVVQTEVSFQAAYEGAPDFLETFAYFRQAGFELLTLSPVSIDFRSLVAAEMDCLFVRRHLEMPGSSQ